MHGIGGVILAAGGSIRLGQPKQLLEFDGETLVHAMVRAAQEGGCERVCVVTGHARQGVENAVAPLRPLLVHNDAWERGIGSSIRLGVQALQHASAIIVLTCDQPAVNAAVIRSLIEEYRSGGHAIVASYYTGTVGIPALFDHTCFAELQRLPDDRGAKSVIQAAPARVTPFQFEAGALDLDTPEELAAWRRQFAHAARVE